MCLSISWSHSTQRTLTWNFPANPKGLWSHLLKTVFCVLQTSINFMEHLQEPWPFGVWENWVWGMCMQVFKRRKKWRRVVLLLLFWRHRQCDCMLSIESNGPLPKFPCLVDGKETLDNVSQLNMWTSFQVPSWLQKSKPPLTSICHMPTHTKHLVFDPGVRKLDYGITLNNFLHPTYEQSEAFESTSVNHGLYTVYNN